MKTKTEYIRLLRQYMTENASKYGISRMGIFGSVARGENTEQSDIDVDIVRLRERMDTFFKDRILSEGIYV